VRRQILAPEIADAQDAPVPLEAYERRRAIPITDEDVAETMELVRWFRRRYPTVKERFAYVSRKYAEWTKHPPARIR
jgi:hypothetical protein